MPSDQPLPASVRDTIDLWVSDFFDRPAALEAGPAAGESGPTVLRAFLEGACHGGKPPADIEADEVAHALLDHVARLSLPAAIHRAVPGLVAAFLADLQDAGRLSGGRVLGAQVRALAPAYQDRALGRVRQEVRPAPKVGRNEPCPCGSGRKYKHCCLRALG